jgi:simple sugar transport system permease protein
MLFTNSMQIWLYAKPFAMLGQGYVLGLPFDIYIVVFILVMTYLVTRRTATGMFIEAVGINPTAARFSGINSKNILLWVYAFSGLCAGISGLIVCSTVMNADGNNAGRLFELDAILAVVLGGTSLNGGKFYLMGSIIGALIIQTLTVTIYAFGVPSDVAPVVKALVVWAFCLLQSPKFRLKVAQMFVRREAST